jgi:hypothetical protein
MLALLMGVLVSCDSMDPAGELDEDSSTVADGLDAGMAGKTSQASDFRADRSHWADAYVWVNRPEAASYTAGSDAAFNRAGGPVVISKPIHNHI